MTNSKSNPTITRVQLSLLRIGKRHRAINKFKVTSLAKSMDALGLRHPISVYDDGAAVHLVAGLHRVKAAMSLGWEYIDAIVVELDEVDREIWEIDENLQRAGLSKAEEREHFKRRKELWLKRQSTQHAPIESKRADGKGHRPKGFAAETAAATGLSKSQINRKLAKSKPGAMKKVAKAKGAKERLDDLSDELGALVAPKAQAPIARAPLNRKPKLETHTGLDELRRLLRGSDADLELAIEALAIDAEIARRIYVHVSECEAETVSAHAGNGTRATRH